MADYGHLTILEVEELGIFDFWALLRDAVIYNRAQTEEGRKWLGNAHRLGVTEPDTKALHAKYG